MTLKVREWVENFVKANGPFEKVLEVGSLDVNGNVRDLFPKSEFIGTDAREGKNVDIVINGHNLLEKFEPESFDLVLCLETLEHDEAFWLTVDSIRKLVKQGGWIVVTVPSIHHPKHNHPGDYYRFTGTAVGFLLAGFTEYRIEEQCYFGQSGLEPDAVMSYARKPFEN